MHKAINICRCAIGEILALLRTCLRATARFACPSGKTLFSVTRQWLPRISYAVLYICLWILLELLGMLMLVIVIGRDNRAE